MYELIFFTKQTGGLIMKYGKIFGSIICIFFCCIGVVEAQIGEGNLVKNPGFEEPAAPHSYAGWYFVNHGQDFIRGEIQAQDYHSGLKAASVTVSQKPKIYVCWSQHICVKEDAQLPDEISLWYRALDNPCQICMSFSAVEDGQVVRKGGTSFNLEKSLDWKKITRKIDIPLGTRDILLEIRVTKEGYYCFDDVSLVRKEKAISSVKPYRLLFVGLKRDKLTPLWKEELKKSGWGKISFEKWDNLTPNLLRTCRIVILAFLPDREEITPHDEAIITLLIDYVKGGGGLLLTQNSTQMFSFNRLLFYLAKRFGTQILFEKTISDPALTKHIGPWGPDKWTYTNKVFGQVSQGIRGVFYQSYVNMGSFAGVLPFLPNKPWRVVLSAGPNSRTQLYLTGLEEIDRNARSKGFEENVPLAGIRDFGKGRVAYIGLNSGPIFCRRISSREDKETYEFYMIKGTESQPSDLLQFYLNTFIWLSAHADNLIGVELTKQKVALPTYTSTWKFYKGIIGPRTTYSSGLSTPEEYVRKAKESGFDFIVFLEEFSKLKKGGFEKLKKECRRLSEKDFLVIPGITYQNTDGNNEYAFGNYLKLPSKKLLDKEGKRFKIWASEKKENPCVDQIWLYGLLSFNNHSGWYLFSENPYPHFDTRDVDSMAVITQQDGKTLEKVFEYYGQEARNGQYLWPLALTLMKSASEIDLIKEGTYYYNVIGAAGTKQLNTFFNTRACRSARHLYPKTPPFGSMFLTNGPHIELKMPRGDTDPEGNIYNPRLQEWKFDLKVTSDVKLKEIKVMDGDTVIRRFLPKDTKTFTYKTSLSKERQKHIWVYARDIKGREAISRDIQSDSWLLREYQCADRNNQLLYSMQYRPDKTRYYIGYGGDTATPDKGPWNGRIKPVGCFVFDEKLGVGSMSYDGSPENHPQVFFNPFVLYNGKYPEKVGWSHKLIAGKEGAPHVQPHRVVASSEVLVGERILDGVFPFDAKPVIHVWHTLYPVIPSEYLKTTARVYFFLPKVDGITAYLWDQNFQILKDIPIKPESLFTICVGEIKSRSATERIIVNKGVIVESGPVKGHSVKCYSFNKSDYIGFLKSPFGSLVTYSLTDGLVLKGDGVNYQVGFKTEGDVLKKGSKVRIKILLVGMHRLVKDPAKLAKKIVKDYGLGESPSYNVEIEKGKVSHQEYILTIESDRNKCFKGKIRGIKNLPGNLGCMVTNLNNNWSAFFQQLGKETKNRIIPVEEGIGYAVLREEDEGKTIFIGHPVLCNNPNIILSIARSEDWKKWILEIHNPTKKEVSVTIWKNPNFTGFNELKKTTIKLPPGSSTFRNLGET